MYDFLRSCCNVAEYFYLRDKTVVIRLLLPIVALLVVVMFIRAYRQGTPETRKRLVFGVLFSLVFGFVLFLTITGRLHYIAAIVTGLLPFAKRLLPFLRYIPLLRRLVKRDDAETTTEKVVNPPTHMTRAQALEILGLQDGATDDEIIDAHRKLMQKCHPDRGGNDFLAAQLNQAKDTLLS